MIQELLSAVIEEKKFSFPTPLHILSDDISPSPFLFTPTSTPSTLSPSSSSSSTIQISPTPSPSTHSEPPQQKLRCPRCDSSNTKFCYYNNYNLTQPRHFCKTCRRYWTKGGALRNVPIGGGCRKAKPPPINSGGKCLVGSNKPNKAIPSFDAISRAGFGFGFGFEPVDLLWTGLTPTPTPIPTHASQLLALLRAGTPVGIRGEPAGNGLGLNGPGSEQAPGLQIQENSGLQSAVGIQELYHKLAYCNDQFCVSMNGGGSSNSAFENANGGDYGYLNPAFSSWSDMSSTNN